MTRTVHDGGGVDRSPRIDEIHSSASPRRLARWLVTLDVRVALRFRDAVLFHEPLLFWRYVFATNDADNCLGFIEEHIWLPQENYCQSGYHSHRGGPQVPSTNSTSYSVPDIHAGGPGQDAAAVREQGGGVGS